MLRFTIRLVCVTRARALTNYHTKQTHYEPYALCHSHVPSPDSGKLPSVHNPCYVPMCPRHLPLLWWADCGHSNCEHLANHLSVEAKVRSVVVVVMTFVKEGVARTTPLRNEPTVSQVRHKSSAFVSSAMSFVAWLFVNCSRTLVCLFTKCGCGGEGVRKHTCLRTVRLRLLTELS